MASKRPRSIHHAMLRCSWVESEALRKAGVPTRDFADLTSPTEWHDEDYPIGPCRKNLDVLDEEYGR